MAGTARSVRVTGVIERDVARPASQTRQRSDRDTHPATPATSTTKSLNNSVLPAAKRRAAPRCAAA